MNKPRIVVLAIALVAGGIAAYLASGETDADLTKLSNEIIAAQEKEIAFLKEWLAKNR